VIAHHPSKITRVRTRKERETAEADPIAAEAAIQKKRTHNEKRCTKLNTKL
jgi:hypothetical protein